MWNVDEQQIGGEGGSIPLAPCSTAPNRRGRRNGAATEGRGGGAVWWRDAAEPSTGRLQTGGRSIRCKPTTTVLFMRGAHGEEENDCGQGRSRWRRVRGRL